MMTMIRKIQIFALLLLMSVIGTGIIVHKSRQRFFVTVFPSGNGWGYNVRNGRKTIIHQPYIPCLEGNSPFEDKNTAQRTGDLIVKKLKNKLSPRISKAEIEAVLKSRKE
jgi:hypothetical protein